MQNFGPAWNHKVAGNEIPVPQNNTYVQYSLNNNNKFIYKGVHSRGKVFFRISVSGIPGRGVALAFYPSILNPLKRMMPSTIAWLEGYLPSLSPLVYCQPHMLYGERDALWYYIPPVNHQL